MEFEFENLYEGTLSLMCWLKRLTLSDQTLKLREEKLWFACSTNLKEDFKT